MGAVHRGGYSLYVRGLQKKHNTMKSLAKVVESFLPGNNYIVTINLYLTPSPSKQGFEGHMDYMDSIVVQIAGCKSWKIYDKSTYPQELQVNNPEYGSMIKPTQKQLAELDYNEHIMQVGSLLYIPKGIIHEAATNCTGDSIKPSVHLTIGIEQPIESKVPEL